MYGYIYKTTNKINNKIYIGQHAKSSWDASYFGSGLLLRYAVKKYGINNFSCELLEWCEDANKLNEREIYWIKHYNSMDPLIGYNMTEGGHGIQGHIHSEETRQIISEASRNRTHINNGVTNKNVPLEEVDSYLNLGWKRGMIVFNDYDHDKMGENVRKSKLGRFYYTNGVETIMISKDEIDYYEGIGYYNGKHFNRGPVYRWMHKDGRNELILDRDVPSMKKAGWELGKRGKGRSTRYYEGMKRAADKKRGVKKPEGFGKKVSEAKKGKNFYTVESKKKLLDTLSKRIYYYMKAPEKKTIKVSERNVSKYESLGYCIVRRSDEQK